MTRRRKKVLMIAGIGFTVYFTGIFFVLSAVLTRMAPGRLTELLDRPVAVERIRVNPLTLSVTVQGLDIRDQNPADPFVRFETLYVNAQIRSLVRRGLILKTVRLERPEIHISRMSDTTFNFSDLLADEIKTGTPTVETKEEREPTDSVESEAPAGPPRFAVADIFIVDGRVVYRDVPFNETHTIAPINWHVPFISNFVRHQDSYSEPALTLSVDGALLTVDVQTKPFKDTMETVVNLALSGLSLPRYTDYLPEDRIGFQVTGGVVDLTTRLSFRQEDNRPVVVARAEAELKDLDVKDRAGDDIFSLPRLAVTVLPSVVTENRLHVGEMLVDSPRLSVVRHADGVINLTGLVADTDEAAPVADNLLPVEDTGPKQPDRTAAPDDPAGMAEPDQPGTTSASAENNDNGFQVDLDRFALINGTARFVDFAAAGSNPRPVENIISGLEVTVTSFSTTPEKQTRFEVLADINDTAPLNVKGQMVLTPFSLESDLDLAGLALAWAEPYLPEGVALKINSGLAACSARLFLTATDNDQIAASVTGNLSVKNFDSANAEKTESFLRWRDFNVDGIKVSTPPLRVAVDRIAFLDLKQQVLIFEDGTTNIEKIFIRADTPEDKPDEGPQVHPEESPEAIESESEETPEVTPVQIGRLVMNNTEFRFADRSVDPHYSTRLTLTDLKITGLTSEDFKAADVAAEGNIDGYAPLSITGTINPLGKDLFLDLDVKLSNLDMAPLSAYTGKYVGRAIAKGKMNLNLQYDINQKVLHANNHILLNQFTLGKTVESPDAMNLPLGLAVALLKDRRGVIDVNLPVTGRTDDPQFKISRIVFKTLTSLIMRAAASPFSLVASLVGGGEEMRFIEFEPGWAGLSGESRKKLETIRKLLFERPALKLEITGYADAGVDRRALAATALEYEIKAPALADLLPEGESVDSQTLASVVLPPEQYERNLRRLYKKEVEETPAEEVEVKKADDPTLTTAEMETALIERRAGAVTDAELGLLAGKRAGQVRDYLLTDETVDPARIFFKSPDNLFQKPEGDFASSRVELGVQ